MSQIKVELQEWLGSDRDIAASAWTSTYDKDTRDERLDDEAKIAALVPRLIREGHGTPIESVIFRFWIKMPIFTDRQHMTHRIASHNGLSGRYRTMPDEFFSTPSDVQDIIDKAWSSFCPEGDSFAPCSLEAICKIAYKTYNEHLEILKKAQTSLVISNTEYKRAREILRGMLPLAGMTERTTIMNLRSFANYQFQRNSNHAQPEIRKVAELMLAEVEKANVCPIAIATLKEIGWKI